jgi:hypothetical protein
MLQQLVGVRFLPRSAQNAAETRRVAALRASVAELASRLDKVVKEQDIQLQRIAQLQQDIDDIKRLLKKSAGGR